MHLGRVIDTHKDSLLVQLDAPIAPGDGIVLEGDRFAGTEIGGRVYELYQDGERVNEALDGKVEICMQRDSLAECDIQAGTQIFKTDDPKLTKRLRRTFQTADPQKRVSIDMDLTVVTGQPLTLSVKAPDAEAVQIACDHVPEEARKHAMNLETLQTQLSRLGGTVYQLGKLSANIEGRPMVPLSVLGKLRKEVVKRLDEVRVTRSLPCAKDNVAPVMLAAVSHDAASKTEDAATGNKLRVLCRSLSQLEQTLASGVKDVIAEFYDLRQYRDAVRVAHEADAKIELATLRIHKPGEDGLFKALAKHGGDGWLVRNLAAARYCMQHEIPMACDFSLNVTNPLSAEQLLNWGATRITASYDMNRDQLIELAAAMPTRQLEVVIHQHMPMFHMEHCVFCSVLSPGKSKSDCGRPCDHHDVQLADRMGAAHVLHADIGCRNTLYNATAQSGAEAVWPLQKHGVSQFRIELLKDADPETTGRLLELYRGLLAGKIDGPSVWQQLQADNRIGVTRGTMEKPRNPLAIL